MSVLVLATSPQEPPVLEPGLLIREFVVCSLDKYSQGSTM